MAKIKIDFTGVESFQKCEAGEHVVKIKKAVSEIAKSSGVDMIKVTFEVVKGNSEGARLFDNFVLSEKALWKLKGFLETVGMEADGKISLDLDKLTGRMCIANVKMEEYNGEDRPKIADYKKLANTEEEEDVFDEQEEEETPPLAKEKKKAKKVPEPEPEEEEEEEDGPVIYENEDGTFELEDGTPCDEDGNPIKKKAKKKAEKEKPEPEPADDWGDDGDAGWDD